VNRPMTHCAVGCINNTVNKKKTDTILLSILHKILNQFLKFFHQWHSDIVQETSKAINKDRSKPQPLMLETMHPCVVRNYLADKRTAKWCTVGNNFSFFLFFDATGNIQPVHIIFFSMAYTKKCGQERTGFIRWYNVSKSDLKSNFMSIITLLLSMINFLHTHHNVSKS